MNFTAKKEACGDYVLKVDGCVFGRLANCETALVFIAHNDDMLNDWVQLEGGMTLGEMLAAAKKGYLAYIANMKAEHEAELASERAFYNHIEHDQESYDHMVMEDMMGKS